MNSVSTTTASSVVSPLIRKRDGRIMKKESNRILKAIEAAFRDEYKISEGIPLDPEMEVRINGIAKCVCDTVYSIFSQNREPVDSNVIEDIVETELMRAGEFKVARCYILFRENRVRERALRAESLAKAGEKILVTGGDGVKRPIDNRAVKRRLIQACLGLSCVSWESLLEDLYAQIYNGIPESSLDSAMILVARQRIEQSPEYSQVASRLLRGALYKEVLCREPDPTDIGDELKKSFAGLIQEGVEAGRIDKRLLSFDLGKLAAALKPERDELFDYLGVQTIYDRYLLHINKRRIETPQSFFMRVAMGLALGENSNREEAAIEFYELLSTFRFVSATPTLFNSGTPHPQLSSCYLTTVDDDLLHIFKCIQDNAMLSKWAGGLGNDWTRVRATGAHIKGTNGESQGVIPFLKVANDTAVAVNQGGKRKGAVCAYLECWHADFEEFLELRKNTGDDRRRTHDMNTAAWVPDLFMKRVATNGTWTLFSPNEVPDLHDLYGAAFETRYAEYEALAAAGKMRTARTVEAVTLWRKMLSMLFETGHPWITFKDPCNVRSPQDHCGVVHSSNLCTEITLNTSNGETAVCNLGSINLKVHTTPQGLDRELLAGTIRTAVRMLDNVVDINYYPTTEAEASNRRHRPIGLGVMGFQDALYIQRIPYESTEAIEFADTSMEFISWHAIHASAELAKERGTYESYAGSKWDRGILPIDSIKLLAQERGGHLKHDTSCSMDWAPVREAIKAHGMRNSNVMAIAPTATISNIAGATQSIEPTFANLYAKSNLSGDFTIVNSYLIEDLKKLGLWGEKTLEALKLTDGSLQDLGGIPIELKKLYKTSFEIDPRYMVEATSRRQKWVDQGISFNLYISQPSGRKLHDMYMLCWELGLKTTYYLRSQAATRIEKSTTVAKGDTSKKTSTVVESYTVPASVVGKACSIYDPTCEACQ
jgi:ribonucleoside-diphosphate reductase alpha chain